MSTETKSKYIDLLAMVDKTLKENAGKQMVPVSDTADVLLDIRGVVASLLNEVCSDKA